MRGHTPGKAHRREETIPHVEIWQQDTFRWLVWKGYHLWESWTEPIMKHISKWHRGVFERSNLDYIPLVNRRNIKCYHLQQKRRDMLAIIYITQEQYDIITGKCSKNEEPRHEVKEPIVPDTEE